MRACVVGLILAAAFAAPGFAAGDQQGTASIPPAAAVPGQDATQQDVDLEEIICKKQGPTTGSHLGNSKICMSRKRWMEQERANQREVEKIQNSASQFGGGN